MAKDTQFPSWNAMACKKTVQQKNQFDKDHHGGESSDNNWLQTAQETFSYGVDSSQATQDTFAHVKQASLTAHHKNRRSSDTFLENKPDEKVFSPSHYKGKRRGTYAAVYDPKVTLTRPRSGTRSRSLFIKAEEVPYPDLRMHLLKSLHHEDHKNISENTDDETKSKEPINEICCIDYKKNERQRERRGKNIQNSIAYSPSMQIDSHENIVDKACRTHSTFNNLSKEHLQYLEGKYEKTRFLAERKASRNCSSSRGNDLTLIHQASKDGDIKGLTKLIDEGHDVNSLDSHGHLPCYYAILNGHFDCVVLLISMGADMQNYFANQRAKYFK